MQIGTQLSFSFPLEILCCSTRGDWEKGDGQEFLLHQSLKSPLSNTLTSLKAALLGPWITCVSRVRLRPCVCAKAKVYAKCERIDGRWMTVAMENVKEWSGRMKNVEDDSGSLILGVNYSNFLQLISTLCDSAVTMLSLCELWSEALQWRLLWAAWKTCIKAGQLHHSLKLDWVLQSLSTNPC